jgi:hypothetical protein
MRAAVWGATLGGLVGLFGVARADIYLFRDRLGVMHFTNAPTRSDARMVIKDRPLPPGTRMLVPLGGLGVGVAILPGSGPLPLALPTTYDSLIREIADRYNVEYALVKAVIKAESDFDRLAVSPKGAQGLMQLMPATAAQHQVRNVFLPRDNIEGGVRHLRLLLDRYGGNLTLTLAAYNAGTQRVEDAGGVPRIAETREYVARVLRHRLAYLREAAFVYQARR